jgi:putative ABC transport system substrate-binding protein
MICRRQFMFALGAGALAAPLAAFAQVPRIWRIGLLHIGLDHVPPSLDGLRDGLRALGYEEGRNLRLDFRNQGSREEAIATAQGFVRDRVDLVVGVERQSIRVAHEIVTDIPVVMLHISNPELEGVIKSLAHPGGNLSGFAGVGEVPAKELEIFKELYPKLSRVLVVHDRNEASAARWMKELRAAAPKLKLRLVERQASDIKSIDTVFASLRPGEVDGVVYGSPALRHDHQTRFIELAHKHRLALLGHRAEWVERGALFSYNVNLREVGRAAAGRYVDRILKGARPADLPVEEISQFDLVVNRKVATSFGIRIPQSIMLRADRVIE